MNRLAVAPRDDRAGVFAAVGQRLALDPAIIEKDFWVCWILKQLFEMEDLAPYLLFKGGTSLSKVFDLIDRFSEDVDLVLDANVLGLEAVADEHDGRSRTQREKELNAVLSASAEFIGRVMTPAIRSRCSDVLGSGAGWAVNVSAADGNTIEFAYPIAVARQVEYVQPQVILEVGPHAALEPSGECTIAPYVASGSEVSLAFPAAKVMAIKAERTFWEKATILHVEHHRPADKPMPARHARHYYDMAMLARSPLCVAAVADLDLLERVVAHKSIYYYAKWSRYDLAVPGTLALVPKPERIAALRVDYAAMRTMFFKDPPPLDEILADLAGLEVRINE